MNLNPIQTAQRNGNLFIKLLGDFNPALARSTVSTINKAYRGTGNVFINTQEIDSILDTGIHIFKQNLKDSTVQHRHLFMVGPKGLDMVPEGSQVIVPPTKKGGSSGCKSCGCGKK